MEQRDRILTLLENERRLLVEVETPKLRAECWVVVDALLDELIDIDKVVYEVGEGIARAAALMPNRDILNFPSSRSTHPSQTLHTPISPCVGGRHYADC